MPSYQGLWASEDPSSWVSWPGEGNHGRNANAQASTFPCDNTVNKHRKHCEPQFLNSAEEKAWS